MENGQPFGSWSLAATGATLLLAQEFHPMVIEVLRAGLNAAWLAMSLSGLLAAALYWAAAKSVGARPGGNLISLAREAAGTPGAALCGLAVSGMLLYHCGFVLRETAEMTVSSLYPHTPQTFAIVALLLASLYGAYGRTDSLVKLSRILLPLLLLGVLVILVGAMGHGPGGPGPAAHRRHSGRPHPVGPQQRTADGRRQHHHRSVVHPQRRHVPPPGLPAPDRGAGGR
jgi:hypothetical protein